MYSEFLTDCHVAEVLKYFLVRLLNCLDPPIHCSDTISKVRKFHGILSQDLQIQGSNTIRVFADRSLSAR